MHNIYNLIFKVDIFIIPQNICISGLLSDGPSYIFKASNGHPSAGPSINK